MTNVHFADIEAASTIRIEVELSISGEPLATSLEVDCAPASLADVVPFARQLADQATVIAIRQARQAGQAISCRKGCAACCKYLIPLSVPELLCFEREYPLHRNQLGPSLDERFHQAMVRIVEAGQPEPTDDYSDDDSDEKADENSEDAAAHVGRWYDSLQLNCPFLANGVCTIYQARPIACRQHLVVSAPESCEGFQPQRGHALPTHLAVCETLTELATEFGQMPAESVMLPLAPLWLEQNVHLAERTWPAEQLFGRFAELLSRQSCQAS